MKEDTRQPAHFNLPHIKEFTMIDEILLECEEHMSTTVDRTREELTTIRTGRANPAMFNGVVADYYGVPTPITQMATVSVPEARMMLIKPYEMSMMGVIENAIRNSDLGVNPTNDGVVIIVSIPQLTEERRKDLIKVVRGEAEEGRVSIRNVRRDANDHIKKLLKDKEISEDEARRGEEAVQKLTDKYITEADKLLTAKEEDLMAI